MVIRRMGWIILCLMVLAAIALVGCSPAATSMPSSVNPTASSVMPIATSAAPEPTTVASPVLNEKRQIVLDWPLQLREGDSDLITLSLLLDENGQLTVTPETQGHSITSQAVQIPNIYDNYHVVAAARLDLAGLDVRQDEMREAMRPGLPVTFRWSIHAVDSGTYRGVVWLYLEFVPKISGDTERLTLLSKPIEVQSVTFLGLPGWGARMVSGAGLLVSTVLGYPFIQRLLEWLWSKRKAGQSGTNR